MSGNVIHPVMKKIFIGTQECFFCLNIPYLWHYWRSGITTVTWVAYTKNCCRLDGGVCHKVSLPQSVTRWHDNYRELPSPPLCHLFSRGLSCPRCCKCFCDLKDASIHIPILKAHRKSLHFAFMGAAYEYQCPLFGYSLALRTFSKCAEAALGPLRHGEITISYLDNWFWATQRKRREETPWCWWSTSRSWALPSIGRRLGHLFAGLSEASGRCPLLLT